MARILMCWEMGAGLGHLAVLKPIAVELIRRGHRVSLALRNLSLARTVFGDMDVDYWQAPIQFTKPARYADQPSTYTQLLGNMGYGSYEHMVTLTAAWRSLFRAISPDVVLFEHSPVALLAAREFEFRRAVVGAGFFCPPTEPEFPRLRPFTADNSAGVREDALVRQEVGRLLAERGLAPLEHLEHIYRDVDATLLCTFAEMDHFGVRPEARYYGVSTEGCGARFTWPRGDGRRIFAYLKPFAALPALLQTLSIWQYPTVVYIDNLDPVLEQRFATANLHFYRQPLDMSQAAAECDLAILNANHATLAAMLLAGKPALLVPLFLEQHLLALRAQANGCAEIANPVDAESLETHLRKMFVSARYAESASRFAAKYADYNAVEAVNELANRLETMASM